MKRIAAALLSLLALVLLLCGCAAGKEGPQAESLSSPERETPAPEMLPDYGGKLRISELMPKNRASLADSDGTFADWAEIENISGETLSLSGWTVSDRPKKRRQLISDESLQPGERIVVFCRIFGISEDETLHLLDPDGNVQDAVSCPALPAGASYALEPDGSFRETVWPSPGFPNGHAGYAAWCEGDVRPSGLQIGEVMVSNEAHPDELGRLGDWVELVNLSGEALDLSGFFLSEDPQLPDSALTEDGAAESETETSPASREGTGAERPRCWAFPAAVLGPGERFTVFCDGEGPASENNTGFSLDAVSESLFLLDRSGSLLDYVFLHDIPVEGSMGRMDGQNGFFYFTEPTPGAPNAGGMRRVSALPVTLTPEGAFDGTDSVRVELAAPGARIFYTTDGSVPTAASALYSEPLELTETTVVRALAVEEDACPSRTATFSYFLNEGHTLPVLSLTVDDWGQFQNIYTFGIKDRPLAAHLALYEDGTVFSRDCSLEMKGWTSLSLPKKSMGVSFTGRCGGTLSCDVFGNGITEYKDLSLRVGQDYMFSVFRNEMIQELCLEASRDLYTQESKYCILYINGAYYGIYCLKDDVTRAFYASHAGVSEESVEGFRAPAVLNSEYYNLIVDYGWHSDLTQEENYRVLCENINMESLIDWFLFEAWCGNTDTQGNLRVYRSTENGNRWEYVLYDLDWAFHYWQGGFRTILDMIGNVGSEMPNLLNNLLKNPDFRDRLLRRYAELVGTVFADDYVLGKIDDYVELLSPEISRDHARWGQTYEDWTSRVALLRDTISENSYAAYTVNDLCRRLGLTEEEQAYYFGTPAGTGAEPAS